MCWCE